jgi:glycosyltransferase involved in cell wall biosynthesis
MQKGLRKGWVSVVIPNCNYAQYVGDAIDSVLAQMYPDIEIIVVDDGSTDASRDVLLNYGDSIKTISQQNHGVSAARNNGVAASSGEFVAFLDADDLWLPEKIAKQIERFAGEPQPGLVHVGVEEIDADGNSLRKRLEGLEGDIAGELLLLKREGVLGGGSGLMVPRAVFDDVGGFDTRLSTSADWDLFYQIARRHAIGFVAEILLRYRLHNSNMRANVAVMEHDMTLAFEKAFANGSEEKKSEAYGNLYKTLAGSYFRAGSYGSFLRTAIESIGYAPGNLAYFATFPIRRLRAE